MKQKLRLQYFFLKGELHFLRNQQKLKEKLRGHHVLYAFLGGIGLVMFWHGIWEGLNIIYLKAEGWLKYLGHPVTSLIIGSLILVLTGLFVFELVGRDPKVFEEKINKRLEELERLEKELEKTTKDIIVDIEQNGEKADIMNA